ncbi:MAG: hypothetical protein GF331_23520 [Chitinivibrionales bacterium]|nr:hypothetical protein [Chitinivibrionales bacterium]
MKTPVCKPIPRADMRFDGTVGSYLENVIEQWLLVAPKANPALLEMLRDRDLSPLRRLVPWAAEFPGKYLIGAVEVLRATGNPRLKAWLREYVHHLIGYQDKDGYLGPWPSTHKLTNAAPNCAVFGSIDEPVGKDPTWDTWGHYQIMLGLLLWHEETGDKEALRSATRIADLLCRMYLGKKKPRLVDTGDADKNLAPVHVLGMLYRKTRSERYLQMARQIAREFSVTKRGKSLGGDYVNQALAGKEFFEFPIPRWEALHPILGLAELYWNTGDETCRQAFEHIWYSIAKLDRHNNGGFSSGEQAIGNPYHGAAIETCCTVAWSAMSVEMLKLAGDSIVADELELTLLNSGIGMFSATGRWSTYNTPMSGTRHASIDTIVFQSREGAPELNCCSVNAARALGLLSSWALMKDREGLLLNYYGPSSLSARVKPGLNVSLTQQTDYPRSGDVAIRVKPSKAASFALKLRVPQWSVKTRVTVNGEAVKDVQAGRYLTIERRWKAGDTVRLSLDMSLHFWRGERECAGRTSVYRGPILLTYDNRYNAHNAKRGPAEVRMNDKWNQATCTLPIPRLDARNIKLKAVEWDDWFAPMLLFECKAANGKTVRLCDFGSAGETGTPYCSWLPVKHSPKAPVFARERPLRTTRV